MNSILTYREKKVLYLELLTTNHCMGNSGKLSECGAELAFSYVNDSIKKE